MGYSINPGCSVIRLVFVSVWASVSQVEIIRTLFMNKFNLTTQESTFECLGDYVETKKKKKNKGLPLNVSSPT